MELPEPPKTNEQMGSYPGVVVFYRVFFRERFVLFRVSGGCTCGCRQGTSLGEPPAHRRAPREHWEVWDLAQGYLGSDLKVFLLPEHLPMGLKPRTLRLSAQFLNRLDN